LQVYCSTAVHHDNNTHATPVMCDEAIHNHHVLGLGLRGPPWTLITKLTYLSHTTNCRGTRLTRYPTVEIQHRCIRQHMSTTGASVTGSTFIAPAVTVTLSSCIISSILSPQSPVSPDAICSVTFTICCFASTISSPSSSDSESPIHPPTWRIRYQVAGFCALLFTTFLRRYFDSRVPRPIYGNKRRFLNAPVSRILSLEPGLCTVDSSRRPSREARARARAARARCM
jgi:hypothetical protein